MLRGRAAVPVKLLGYLVFLGILTSCAAASGPQGGRVHQGIYHSPAGNFTVPAPPMSKVSDGHHAGYGGVSFHSDLGRNVGIHYSTVPGGVEEMLSDWLSGFAMPTWFTPVSPGSRIMAEADGVFEGMPARFALIDAPEAHALVVMTFGEDGKAHTRRLDSRRVAIIFRKDNHIYMITTETALPAFMNTTPSEPDEDWVRRGEELQAFYRTIAFRG
jgi:hypothetical protein